MNRELWKKMSMYSGIKDANDPIIVLPDYVPNESELDNILREIFSVDELTGLPKGDLAYYLSPDGNPTVKQWLENNLLKPRSSHGENISELTDDIIAEYHRGADESVSDYQKRLIGYYDSAISEFEKLNNVDSE